MSDSVESAADAVYAVAPEDFLTTRAELAAAAKAEGDAVAAKAIAALRKPTLAASLVNRLVLGDGSVLSRVADLGDRLRAAHDALDAAVLRELTTERRTLVASLTRSATKGGASPAVRDEVSATFDAAVADPSVTVRLGRLTKGERWSGFGVAPAGPPTLTIVRGGRAAPAKKAAPPPTKTPPAAKAKLTRLLTRAQEAFDAAEDELTAADGAERAAGERVHVLTAELAAAQRALEAAKAEQDAARKAARAARTRRREARAALDRAERNRERG